MTDEEYTTAYVAELEAENRRLASELEAARRVFLHLDTLSQTRTTCEHETPSQNTNAILFQSRLRNGAYWGIVTDLLDAYDALTTTRTDGEESV